MIYLDHSKRQSKRGAFDQNISVLANVESFGTAVTVRDVGPILSNGSIGMKSLTCLAQVIFALRRVSLLALFNASLAMCAHEFFLVHC